MQVDLKYLVSMVISDISILDACHKLLCTLCVGPTVQLKVSADALGLAVNFLINMFLTN